MFGLLGVLKAHYGMLPLEDSLPIARLEYMLTSAKPKLMVISKKYKNLYKKFKDFCPPVTYIEDLVKAPSKLFLADFAHQSHWVAAYFTSGSTGLPKGTLITTKGMVNRFSWGWSKLPFDYSDKVIHKSSLIFLDSFTEIVATLLAGVPLVVASQDEKTDLEVLINLMNKQLITRSIMVPTFLKSALEWVELLAEHEKLPSLKTVVTSGENLPVKVARDFFSIFPGNRPGQDPVLFKTGDNVKVLQGNVMYLGRSDNLVKIRGQRFDLSEVSHVAEKLECVTKTITLSVAREKSENIEIICFYVGEGDNFEIEAKLKKAWVNFLPNYVKPIPFRILGDIPRGATGKINRLELLERYRNS